MASKSIEAQDLGSLRACNAFSRTVQTLTNEAHSETELEEGTFYLPDYGDRAFPTGISGKNEFSKCSKWSSASICPGQPETKLSLV